MDTTLTAAAPRRAPLDTRPAVRAALAIATAAILALTLAGLVRWLSGAAPPTPWVRETALAIHLATVIPALPLGAWVLLARKGGRRHRTLGYVWLSLMLVTAVATLFVRNVNGGGFSWIHGLTLLTFLAIPKAVMSARRRDIAAHRRHLLNFFVGSLLVAGVFTFLPGRTMAQWLLADAPAAGGR